MWNDVVQVANMTSTSADHLASTDPSIRTGRTPIDGENKRERDHKVIDKTMGVYFLEAAKWRLVEG